MKKILALLLVVSSVLALGSCKLFKKDTTEDETPKFDAEVVAAIQAKIDASAPVSANVTVTLASSLDDVKGEYNVTYNADGSATVEYYYEKLNSFDENSDEYKSSFTGTTTVSADGTVTDELGGTASVEAITFDINLDPAKIYDATVSAGVLNATVKAENAAAVIGVDVKADVNVVVTYGSAGVTSVAISYVSAAGPVEIVATYNYN